MDKKVTALRDLQKGLVLCLLVFDLIVVIFLFLSQGVTVNDYLDLSTLLVNLFFSNLLVIVLIWRVLENKKQNIQSELFLVFSFKIIIISITYLVLLFHNGSLMMFAMSGDDYKYTTVAWQLKNDGIFEVWDKEPNGYGFPYTFFLILLYKVLPVFYFPILVQVILSVYTSYLFYKVMLLLFKPRKDDYYLRLSIFIVFLVFAYHPISAMIAGSFYKDSLLVFLIVAFIYVLYSTYNTLFKYISLVLLAVLAVFFRPQLGILLISVAGFYEIVKVSRFRGGKKVVLYIGLFMIVATMAVLFKDNLIRGLSSIYYIESYLDRRNDSLGGSVDISFKSLLGLSMFAMMIPPPAFGIFPSEWRLVDILYFSARFLNLLIFPFFIYGIIKSFDYKYKKVILLPLFTFMGVSILGMAITGLILTDRHKFMVYIPYLLLSVIGLRECFIAGQKGVIYLICGYTTVFSVAIGYNYMRLGSYGI